MKPGRTCLKVNQPPTPGECIRGSFDPPFQRLVRRKKRQARSTVPGQANRQLPNSAQRHVPRVLNEAAKMIGIRGDAFFRFYEALFPARRIPEDQVRRILQILEQRADQDEDIAQRSASGGNRD